MRVALTHQTDHLRDLRSTDAAVYGQTTTVTAPPRRRGFSNKHLSTFIGRVEAWGAEQVNGVHKQGCLAVPSDAFPSVCAQVGFLRTSQLN